MMDFRPELAERFPEITIDPMIDISDTKMYGTGMWFNTSASKLLIDQERLSDADYVIMRADFLLNKIAGKKQKTLDDLRRERLRQLGMEE